jgi:hypothetical protein
VLFIGLLWLLGLPCDRERHRYVTDLSQQAMKLVIAPRWEPPLMASADAQSRPGRAAGQSGHLPCCDETVIRMAPQWPQLIWQVLQQDGHQCFSVSGGSAVQPSSAGSVWMCRISLRISPTWREAGSGAAGGLANVDVVVMVLPLWLA